LNLNTGHTTWWKNHGIGCEEKIRTVTTNGTAVTQEKFVTGCVLDYMYVEIIQAGVQIFWAIVGFGLGVYVAIAVSDEDDHFDFLGPGGVDSFSNGATNVEIGHKRGHMQLQAM
jgi:hypothetical protein